MRLTWIAQTNSGRMVGDYTGTVFSGGRIVAVHVQAGAAGGRSVRRVGLCLHCALMVERDDLRATIEARREVGQELEPELIDQFVERIEKRIAETGKPKPPVKRDTSGDDKRLALAIVSLVVAIPLTAIGVTQADLVGLAIVWIGIVLVNLAYSLRH